MRSRSRPSFRLTASVWTAVLLWLLSATAGRVVPLTFSERLVDASSELHAQAAPAPVRAERAERLGSPKPHGRWTPTIGPGATVVAPVVSGGALLVRFAAARGAAIRPRRLTFRYDATAPPLAL